MTARYPTLPRIFLVGSLLSTSLYATPVDTNRRSSTPAVRISQAPKIDGRLDEAIWEQLPVLSDFSQYSPHNGSTASQKTVARVGYDDTAIYVGAVCYDELPEEIVTEISLRDQHGLNPDIFGVLISTFDDGIHSLFFDVTAAGVQRDLKFSGDDYDVAWDAVWDSEVSLSASGWIVEMKIPFSALRFSGRPIQNWGFNLWRWIAREREWSTWSYVDNAVQGWWKQSGKLQGLSNLKPPLRLSFTPFVTAYAEHGTEGLWRHSFTWGADLKYGLNDSFTLDVTLVPDFGQILSDEEVLNLTPYEIQFREKRQFFMEGMELFRKADLFYSRRIGDRPTGRDDVDEELEESETVLRNPIDTRLLNATKLSGRTDFGLGIGILNAMTREASATVLDRETGGKRSVATQPFTNYNLFVLDQTLFTHSYLSFINSNVWRGNYMANVAGTEIALADGSNTYRMKGIGAISRIQDEWPARTGFKSLIQAGKVSGRYQYGYDLSVVSDDYDQNDMGYLRRNNEIVHNVSFSQHIFEPFSFFLNMTNRIGWTHSRMYHHNEFSESVIRYDFSTNLQNHYHWTAFAGWAPFERKDYYEPRAPGRFFVNHRFYEYGLSVQTDPRTLISGKMEGQVMNSYGYVLDVRSWSARVSPLFRLSDQIQIGLEYFYGMDANQPGFVETDPHTEEIYFGRRDRDTGIGSIQASYIVTNRTSLTGRLRYYWSSVAYDSYYLLQQDGRLEPLEQDVLEPFRYDVQYNAFNLDVTYRWEFAPGSEIVVNWKNAIYTDDERHSGGYWGNLRETLNEPQTNSISVRFLYYFDHLRL